MTYDKLLEQRCFELENDNLELRENIKKINDYFKNPFELSFRLLLQSSLENRTKINTSFRDSFKGTWISEQACIQFSSCRQSGHTSLIKNVLPDYFKSILIVKPNEMGVRYATRDVDLRKHHIVSISNFKKALTGTSGKYDCIVCDNIRLTRSMDDIFNILVSAQPFQNERGTFIMLQNLFL